MDQAKQREIASKGGKASGGNFAKDPKRAAEAGRKGGQASSGNFAHNRERAAQAGRKGGEASGGSRSAASARRVQREEAAPFAPEPFSNVVDNPDWPEGHEGVRKPRE